MSAGDLDNKLGPPLEYDRLLAQNNRFRAYMEICDGLPIIDTFDIPFGAGISTDGLSRFVHRRLRTVLEGVDLKSPLARHESCEWALREYCRIGVVYASDPRGHWLANLSESYRAYDILRGVWYHSTREQVWDYYNAFLDPQLKHIETLIPQLCPTGLAMYPYVGTKYYQEIHNAQLK